MLVRDIRLANSRGRLTNDKRDWSLGVLLENCGNGVDVCLVLVETVLGNVVLSIGGQSRAVTVGQVVNNECADDRRVGTSGVLCLDISHVSVHGGNLGGGVTV